MLGHRIRTFASKLATADGKVDFLKERLAWKLFVHRLERQKRINQAFDLRYGTDTAAEIPLEDAGVPREDAERGRGLYRPFWEEDFRAALSQLSIPFEEFTFVDIGSGKGKLLLLASDYPFRRIVGVEYAPLLHKIAQRNLAIYRSDRQRCHDIAAELGDAVHYRLPDGPVVCIIFNALDEATTRLVMRNIAERSQASTRPIYVLYANLRRMAEIGDAMTSQPEFVEIRRGRKFMILANACARGEASTRQLARAAA